MVLGTDSSLLPQILGSQVLSANLTGGTKHGAGGGTNCRAHREELGSVAAGQR